MNSIDPAQSRSLSSRKLSVFFAATAVIAVLAAFTADAVQPALLSITLGNVSYQVEVAKTASERQRGLMYRSSLPARQGMLFYYPDNGEHRIWMKNTLISLQVIWIDEKFRVIESMILHPCSTSNCPAYGPGVRSRYVLEINAAEARVPAGLKVQGILPQPNVTD